MEVKPRAESGSVVNGDANYGEPAVEPTHATLAEIAEESFVHSSALCTTENGIAELLDILE